MPYTKEKSETSRRGLAAADEQTRERVSKAGGQAVSQNRSHMAEIGRKGGETVSKDRSHMAEIGRKGGQAPHGHRGSQQGVEKKSA